MRGVLVRGMGMQLAVMLVAVVPTRLDMVRGGIRLIVVRRVWCMFVRRGMGGVLGFGVRGQGVGRAIEGAVRGVLRGFRRGCGLGFHCIEVGCGLDIFFVQVFIDLSKVVVALA